MTGHHGSHNGTTAALLARMSPRYAVLNVGRCFDGAPTLASGFSTFSYRHPRAEVVELLMGAIERTRKTVTVLGGTSKTEMAHNAVRFRPITLKKSIFATGWDGRLRATLTADVRIGRLSLGALLGEDRLHVYRDGRIEGTATLRPETLWPRSGLRGPQTRA